MRSLVVGEGIVWLALVALTLLGFFIYEQGGSSTPYVVLGAGLVKFTLIFYDFMEMKHANRIWLIAMALFMFAIFGAITVVLAGGVSE